MPIDPPLSGAPLTQADIPAMHETVRLFLNNLGPSSMGPEAVGPDHLPSAVVFKTAKDVTTQVTVNTSPALIEDVTAIAATWQAPAEWEMDNGGAGFNLPDCIFVYGCTIRMGSFASSFDDEHQVWANLYYEQGGVDQTTLKNSRLIFGQDGSNFYLQTEDTITIFRVVNLLAGVVDRVGVRFALNRAGSGSAVPDFTVENGQVWFIAFYRES